MREQIGEGERRSFPLQELRACVSGGALGWSEGCMGTAR